MYQYYCEVDPIWNISNKMQNQLLQIIYSQYSLLFHCFHINFLSLPLILFHCKKWWIQIIYNYSNCSCHIHVLSLTCIIEQWTNYLNKINCARCMVSKFFNTLILFLSLGIIKVKVEFYIYMNQYHIFHTKKEPSLPVSVFS